MKKFRPVYIPYVETKTKKQKVIESIVGGIFATFFIGSVIAGFAAIVISDIMK